MDLELARRRRSWPGDGEAGQNSEMAKLTGARPYGEVAGRGRRQQRWKGLEDDGEAGRVRRWRNCPGARRRRSCLGARRRWSWPLAGARRKWSWSELKDGGAGRGLGEGGADQSKFDETKHGDGGGGGQGSERVEWPRLGAGAGRTLDGQIIPKTFYAA